MTPLPPYPPIPDAVLDWVDPVTGKPNPPSIRVSPLDKNAHLRRTVGEHQEVLQVHQGVLQQHAEIHQVQARARETLKRDVERLIEPLGRSFMGRLRWLFRGK